MMKNKKKADDSGLADTQTILIIVAVLIVCIFGGGVAAALMFKFKQGAAAEPTAAKEDASDTVEMGNIYGGQGKTMA